MTSQDVKFIESKFGDLADASGRSIAAHGCDTADYLVGIAKRTGEIDAGALHQLYLGALGHDLLEDTAVSRSAIKKLWGNEALSLILALTNSKGDSDFSGYLRHLKTAPEGVLLIKLADIRSNIAYSVNNRRLDKVWAKKFWLPLLKRYQKAFFGRKFLAYPKTARVMIADIEKKMAALAKKIN